METNKKEKNQVYCSCDNCQQGSWHNYHKFFWLRSLLGFLILAIIFVVGLKIGEFKGYLDAGGFGNAMGHGFYHTNIMPMPFYQSFPGANTSTTTK